MSATSRNQNSGNQNSAGEDVPLTAITPTQTGDENNSSQGAKKGADSKRADEGARKDTNDNSADPMYNPETAIASSPLDDIPEGFNIYRNKKTLTQGLMDIALFSANANQLRYILEHASLGAFFYITASLIIISLILQVGVGLLLLISTRYNLTIACQRELAYKYGNYVVGGIFLITVINIFIAAFGGPAVAFPAATTAAPAIDNSGGT